MRKSKAQGIEVKKAAGTISRKSFGSEVRWLCCTPLDGVQQKKAICGENHNSYSKTDTDATFMHMKDDHMRNGPAKTRI